MQISINIRFALATTALFLTSVAVAAWFASGEIEKFLLGYVEHEQSYHADQIANLLDRQLLEHRKAVVTKAALITSDLMNDPQRMQRFMDESAALKTLFAGGSYLFGRDGTLLAESPIQAGRKVTNFAFRDYFKDTVRLREPVISFPFISSNRHEHPVIMITAPVFREDGALIGVLGGALDLAANGLFSLIRETELPHKGYFSLIAGDGTIIMHRDASRIMAKMDSSVFAGVAASASVEQSSTIYRTNHRGANIISAVKRLRSTGWILTVNADRDAVYSPIYKTRKAFLAILAIGSPVMILLIIILSRTLTAPLRSMTRQVGKIQDVADTSQRVSVNSRDEVMKLAGAVNSMLDTIASSQRLIQEKEQLFLTWFGRSKDAIVVLSDCWQIIDINQSGYQLLGLSSPGNVNLAGLVPDSIDAIGQSMRRFGFVKDVEVNLAHPCGHPRVALFSCEIIQEHDGVPTIYLGIFHDITEQVKLTQQLRHSQKMEAVGRIAGGVAHDFNNMICAMIGFCSLAKLKIREGDPGREYLDQISALTERGASLTRSLLTFSRKQILAVKPESINEIINSVSAFLARIIGEDIRLEASLSDDDIIVMADRGQIEQVLMNLATNARDAMPDGGMLFIGISRFAMDADFIRVHGYGTPGSYAVVTVEDTGTGMDGRTMEKIFEPFFTTKDEGKGTGLGMAIVYGIVKQHKGFINVYSELSKGTTFRIYLPTAEKQQISAEKETEKSTVVRGSETILLVEDETTLRLVMRNVLAEHGYQVIEAEHGVEAVELFQQHKDVIHLVLMDVIMPGMNGKEASRMIRSVKSDAKVLLISGYTADHLSAKGIAEEGLHFISKPVSPNELLWKIRDMLSG